MKVSIITAFYHGNAYMDDYVKMIQTNQANLEAKDELEAIIINDSPDVSVELPVDGSSTNIWVYDQPENGGIHSARVHGLKKSTGEYVMFLDQDDVLSEDAIARHIKKIKQWQSQMSEVHSSMADFANTGIGGLLEYPVTVSNCLWQREDGEDLLYRSEYHKKQVANYETYIKVGNQIISPGQTLIPKNRIPKLWVDKICKKNGSDDYYLWLLLLSMHIPFLVIDEPLYVHKYTAVNLSADDKKMDDSSFEFISYLEEAEALEPKDLAKLKETISYKSAFRNGSVVTKLIETVKHLPIFLVNVRYKRKTKTPYGYHR